jgi:hypothetical protein
MQQPLECENCTCKSWVSADSQKAARGDQILSSMLHELCMWACGIVVLRLEGARATSIKGKRHSNDLIALIKRLSYARG